MLTSVSATAATGTYTCVVRQSCQTINGCTTATATATDGFNVQFSTVRRNCKRLAITIIVKIVLIAPAIPSLSPRVSHAYQHDQREHRRQNLPFIPQIAGFTVKLFHVFNFIVYT